MQPMMFGSTLRCTTLQSPVMRCVKGASLRYATQVMDYREELRVSCWHGNHLLALPPVPNTNGLDRFSASSVLCNERVAYNSMTCLSATDPKCDQLVLGDHTKLLNNCNTPLSSETVEQIYEDSALRLALSHNQFVWPPLVFIDVPCYVTRPSSVNYVSEEAASQLNFKDSAWENGEKKRAASKEQLLAIKKEFEKYLPSMLQSSVPHRLFNQHVLVEDRFWGNSRTYRGLSALTWTATKYRYLAKLCYAQTHVEVMRISVSEPLSRITIRWRVYAFSYPQMLKRVFLNQPEQTTSALPPTSKVPSSPSSSNGAIDSGAIWIDGYFELQVNSSGRISRMKIDRVDEDRSGAEVMVLNKLITKLIAAFGLRRQELFLDLLKTCLSEEIERDYSGHL